MHIHLIAVGTRQPAWIDQGYDEYAARMPRECTLRLRQIPTAKRRKSVVVQQQIELEGQRILAAIRPNSLVVVLDTQGIQWSTEQLADQLGNWLQSGRELTFVIGGPDGLSARCIHRADYLWSLSPLTFPHALVRVIVAEQLYRAWCILRHHPYHRR